MHTRALTYIALQLTLSGRSSGAEYTCYQSGHIPNHSTIADQLLPRKVPRSTNLSYSTLHLSDSRRKAPFSFHVLFSLPAALLLLCLHPFFPPPSFHPHPLPKRQSTCTAAFVVDREPFFFFFSFPYPLPLSLYERIVKPSVRMCATGPPLPPPDWLLMEAMGCVLAGPAALPSPFPRMTGQKERSDSR